MIKRDNYILFFIQAVITVSYSSLFTYLLFFARRRRGITDRYLTIVPLKTTINNFLKINSNEHYELYNYCTNLFGNIILFVPLPFFLIHLARIQSFRTLILISFILSLSVELLQFIFKRGVADIDDILLNLLGTSIGFLSYKLLWSSVAVTVRK